LTDLTELAHGWIETDARVGVLECRHFFSGAAVYRNDAIVATLTPVGLAFKVPDEIHEELIANGRATPLRYFSKSPIKRNYVLYPDPGSVTTVEAARMILGEHPGTQ